MNVKLIAAAIAFLELTACSPDVTPEANRAAAQAPVEQQVAQTAQPVAGPAAQEEKKTDNTASPVEAKTGGDGKKDD